MKERLSYFSDMKNDWWGRPIAPEILGQIDPVRAKTPTFNRYSVVTPQSQ